MEWQLIESDQDLARVITEAGPVDSVMVDTEFMRRNTFFPQVALVQLSFGGTAWLIDPLLISDPGPLAKLLTDPSVIKVLHSVSEDLEVFQRWLGVMPAPLFDTQRAAAMLDMGFGLGYGALVNTVCEVELEKGETRSDWLQRPLREAQCHYAAQDVTYLHTVYQELARRCREHHKFDWVLADGEDAVAGLASKDHGYFKRIKSAWKLNSRQLARLMAVCEWREETARSRDKPRSWIIDDSACLQLAQFAPETLADLQSQGELPSAVVRRYGETLLNIVGQQSELPEDSLPARLPEPMSATQRNRVKLLKKKVEQIAKTLTTVPQILMAAKDYEALLREAEGVDIELPRHWQGWRKTLVVTPLREYLADVS
ncbi:MAG: ribonuclease D [Alcanivorax sp.]|jgi:ribonuclease D